MFICVYIYVCIYMCVRIPRSSDAVQLQKIPRNEPGPHNFRGRPKIPRSPNDIEGPNDDGAQVK